MITKGNRVDVIGVGFGTVVNVRTDDRGVALITVSLDDVGITPDGLFIARPWELKRPDGSN